jgi:hypothetical protein
MTLARQSIDRRALCDKLRQELGITEEWSTHGRRAGVEIGTAGEFRALRDALRLELKQIEARFKVPRGTLTYWLKQETKAPIYASQAIAPKLIEAMERARELKLLTADPGLRSAKRAQPKPRSGVAVWRCTQCTQFFRRMALKRHPDGDFVHALPDGGESTGFCGPVVVEERGKAVA